MLVAKGLRKKYKQREVVKDFGLTLDAGEVVGLLGPNGAGKTTCFYMIVGLVAADAGSIVLDGKDITGDPMYTRAKQGVGYLPQEPSVFRKLTVADNLRLVLELREDLDSAGRERELNSLLDELQLGHVADQLGASLSGGERRRCEIARAAARHRRVDHRPQCARDLGNLRPRVYPRRGHRTGPGLAGGDPGQRRCAPRLPWGFLQAVTAGAGAPFFLSAQV
jgi:lipopolysaccharide export system ATP-binding protein